MEREAKAVKPTSPLRRTLLVASLAIAAVALDNNGSSPGPNISQQTHQTGGPLYRRFAGRRAGSRRRAERIVPPRTEHRHREPVRRRRHARQQGCRQCQPGWLCPVVRDQFTCLRVVRQSGVRSDHQFCAGRDGGGMVARAGGAAGPSGQDAAGVDRSRQGQPGYDDLRLRHQYAAANPWRNAQDRDGCRYREVSRIVAARRRCRTCWVGAST